MPQSVRPTRAASIDAPKIRAAVSAAMDNGRLAVPEGNAELTIAAGQIHLSNAVLHAQNGAELSLDGMLDLNEAAIDAHLTLSGQAGRERLDSRPAGIRRRREGSAGGTRAKTRRFDVGGVADAARRRVADPPCRIARGQSARRTFGAESSVRRRRAIRFIPMGTALETIDHASASAARRSAGARSIVCSPKFPCRCR